MTRSIFLLTGAGLLMGCAPKTWTETRVGFEPYAEQEYRQTHGGILLENHTLKEMPAEFIGTTQACDGFQLVVDANGRPLSQRVSLLDPGAGYMVYKVSLSNETGHVVRLGSMVTRLFDPASNTNEPVSKDALKASLQQSRPCPSTTTLMASIDMLKLVDRNVELVPGTTYTGYMIFRPGTNALSQTGMWKLGLYEVPVETDAAGRVTETVRFEVRSNALTFEDTWTRKNLLAQPELLETRVL